jgi:hypothetical protein
MKRLKFIGFRIALFVSKLLLDYHTSTAGKNRHSVIKKIKISWRYRLAALGVSLTENERKLARLRNIHKGERCFIIGNGPSLNHLDLKKLKSEYTFGVNAIYLNQEKMGFAPTYHVVEDTFVAEDRSDEISNYKNSIKFAGNHLDYCLKNPDSFIWLNVMFDYSEYKNFPKFSKNSLRKIWVGGTVSYLCMQLAYYMGFAEVYLIGFDHNYTIPDDAIIDGKDIESASEDVNHFTGSYFGPGKRWHDPALERMELAYSKARMFFEADGRLIRNASLGGHLEAFQRCSYRDLFG